MNRIPGTQYGKSDWTQYCVPGKKARLAASVAGAAVAMLGLLGLSLPLLGRLGLQRAAMRALRTHIADTTALLPRLPEQERVFQDARRRMDAFRAQIDASDSLAGMLDLLREEARRRHLEFSATQAPHEPSPDAGVALAPEMILHPIPVTLRLVGRYRHLGEFLGALDGLPLVLEVQTVAVSQKPEWHPRLEATITLAVYVRSAS